jgi:RNA polymerase sigma-70 factor (ECF subfamily)
MEETATLTTGPETADELALLAGLRAGEGSAYEKLVRGYSGRLLAVARRILGNEEDAREALQDAFLSAFRALASFEGKARLSTWLHRIVVNASLAKLRRQQRREKRSIDDLLPKFLSDGHQADPAEDWTEMSEIALQRQETRALVREAIMQLPETYRTVLLLRDIEGLETEETARLLGVTAGVVKTRLHRARQALRTILDPHFRGGSL